MSKAHTTKPQSFTWLERDIESLIRAGAIADALDLAELAEQFERSRTPAIAALLGGERNPDCLTSRLRGPQTALCSRCRAQVVAARGTLCPECDAKVASMQSELDALTDRGEATVAVTWRRSVASDQTAILCREHAGQALRQHAGAAPHPLGPALANRECELCAEEACTRAGRTYIPPLRCLAG